jgi:TIR domain
MAATGRSRTKRTYCAPPRPRPYRDAWHERGRRRNGAHCQFEITVRDSIRQARPRVARLTDRFAGCAIIETAEYPIPTTASSEFGLDKQMSESNKAVFLSYTSQDSDAARRICESLREAAIEVWLDQSDLRGGDAWDAAIRKQIKTCALFMPVISANASARAEGYFRLEWKLAVDRSHLIAAERAFILPVVIDETRDDEALVPDKFREVQWTSCPAGEAPAKFVERVAHLLSPGDHKVPTANVQATGTIPPAPARPRTPRRLVLIGAITVVALLVVGAVVAYKTAFHSAAIGMVAVLPFENATGDPANEYLSNGISESLINKLSGLSGLHVISRTSAFALKGKKLDPTEIGKKLVSTH